VSKLTLVVMSGLISMLGMLKDKAVRLEQQLKGYKIEYRGLSLEDLND